MPSLKRSLLLFMLIACGYSWTLWALMMASAQGWLPFNFPTNFLGSFGPSLAALILSARQKGGVRAVLRSCVQWRFGGRWYAAALLGPPLLIVLALGVMLLSGQSSGSPVNLDKAVWLPVLFIVILILGGPLGEELGWRGYLLPRLLQRTGPLKASFGVAAFWFLWHVPLFWLEGAAQKGSSMALFAAMVAAFSVLFTWLWMGTGGSLLAALLAHTMVNLTSVCVEAVFPDAGVSDVGELVLAGFLVAAAFLVVALKWPGTGGKLATPSPAS
jgi:uncharacterized protein